MLVVHDTRVPREAGGYRYCQFLLSMHIAVASL